MPANGPVKVGIIGLGRAGWGMHVPELRALEEKFRVVAGCDVIEERADKLAAEFGAAAYSNHRDLIADPNVELAVVATRQDTHAEITIDALHAGRDVLVEKPVALTLEETDRMIKAAQQSGQRLLARQNLRHDPAFLLVQQIIRSQILGRVFYIRLCQHGYRRRDDWQTLTEYGGGQLNNWGPHIVDHALQFLGGLPAEMFSDLDRVAAVGDAEDHVKIAMRGESGLVVDLEISGGAALGEPPYRVMGTLGTMVCDGQNATIKYLDPAELEPKTASAETPPQEGGFGTPEELPWKQETRSASPEEPPPAFYEMVYATMREGKDFPITLQEVRDIMWVMENARQGRRA